VHPTLRQLERRLCKYTVTGILGPVEHLDFDTQAHTSRNVPFIFLHITPLGWTELDRPQELLANVSQSGPHPVLMGASQSQRNPGHTSAQELMVIVHPAGVIGHRPEEKRGSDGISESDGGGAAIKPSQSAHWDSTHPHQSYASKLIWQSVLVAEMMQPLVSPELQWWKRGMDADAFHKLCLQVRIEMLEQGSLFPDTASGLNVIIDFSGQSYSPFMMPSTIYTGKMPWIVQVIWYLVDCHASQLFHTVPGFLTKPSQTPSSINEDRIVERIVPIIVALAMRVAKTSPNIAVLNTHQENGRKRDTPSPPSPPPLHYTLGPVELAILGQDTHVRNSNSLLYSIVLDVVGGNHPQTTSRLIEALIQRQNSSRYGENAHMSFSPATNHRLRNMIEQEWIAATTALTKAQKKNIQWDSTQHRHPYASKLIWQSVLVAEMMQPLVSPDLHWWKTGMGNAAFHQLCLCVRSEMLGKGSLLPETASDLNGIMGFRGQAYSPFTMPTAIYTDRTKRPWFADVIWYIVDCYMTLLFHTVPGIFTRLSDVSLSINPALVVERIVPIIVALALRVGRVEKNISALRTHRSNGRKGGSEPMEYDLDTVNLPPNDRVDHVPNSHSLLYSIVLEDVVGGDRPIIIPLIEALIQRQNEHLLRIEQPLAASSRIPRQDRPRSGLALSSMTVSASSYHSELMTM
jgi:hypothetical protein